MKGLRAHLNEQMSGFTLLEVLIAITIMTIAFSAILTSESGSIHQMIRSKENTIAGWLVHRAMVESEELYEGKPFSELPKEKTDKFPSPYDNYTWKREILEIQLPNFLTGQGSEEKQQGTTSTQELLTKVLTKYFKDAVRELVITVQWEKGGVPQKLVLSTYLIDLNAELKFAL